MYGVGKEQGRKMLTQLAVSETCRVRQLLLYSNSPVDLTFIVFFCVCVCGFNFCLLLLVEETY